MVATLVVIGLLIVWAVVIALVLLFAPESTCDDQDATGWGP